MVTAVKLPGGNRFQRLPAMNGHRFERQIDPFTDLFAAHELRNKPDGFYGVLKISGAVRFYIIGEEHVFEPVVGKAVFPHTGYHLFDQ